MTPAISQVCTLNAPFDKDIEDFAAAHCGAVELWLGKLETWLESHGIEEVVGLLRDHGLAAPVASYQGGLLTSQGEARRVSWEQFERRLDLCQRLGVRTIVVAGDVHGRLEQQDFERLKFSLLDAAEKAAKRQMRVALEFQARATFPNNLQSAVALVEDLAHPALGVCLDLFHFYCGPSKTEDLGLLTPANLFHVQLCDVAGAMREWAADADRILPGDGDLPLAPLVEHLRAIDYQGPVSVELMNPQIWQIAPRQVGEIAMTALRKTLGLASMD